MIDFTSVTRTGTNRYKYEWSAVNGPFRIYSNGLELAGQTANEAGGYDDTEFSIDASDASEPPALEVLDSTETDEPLSLQYPPRLVIQWRGDIYADHYRVEQYVSGAWTLRRRVPEQELGYYTFTSDLLADGSHLFRVLSVDPYGNLSTARTQDISFAGTPLPPSISLSYSAGTGDLTVSAR